MKNAITSSNLRSNLFDVLDAVESEEKYLLITRDKKPVSVLVNLDYFEDLLALKSKKYLKEIREARAQYKSGETQTFDEVFGGL